MAEHPLQSRAWGEFRKKTGVRVERVNGIQVTIHRIPKTNLTVGYFPKGEKPTKEQLRTLNRIGERNNCIFVKMEPNVGEPIDSELRIKNQELRKFLLKNGCKPGRQLFTKYSFQIDLRKSEEELLKQMKSKTRYNTRLAERKGVVVEEDNSREAFEKYLKLTSETTMRQGFFAHSEDYHRKMWKVMHNSKIARLLVAKYKKEVLTTWIVFIHKGVIYYPYGASSSKYRNLMASNLMMWEVIKLGKKLKCKTLDMWGALGHNPDPKDSWYGFHRFKEGYGGRLVEYAGTYDLVLKPALYPAYKLSNAIRWKALRIYAKLKSGRII